MIASLRQEPGDAARNYSQRAADALAELVTGEKHLRPATSLLLIADYDTLAGPGLQPRLDDGTPLPADLLAELATNAKVLPAVFDAKWANSPWAPAAATPATPRNSSSPPATAAASPAATTQRPPSAPHPLLVPRRSDRHTQPRQPLPPLPRPRPRPQMDHPQPTRRPPLTPHPHTPAHSTRHPTVGELDKAAQERPPNHLRLPAESPCSNKPRPQDLRAA